jgi:hypothetical protein
MIIKILKRHWLPLGAFVLTFILLSWLLQPRPREAHTFAINEEYSLWGYGDWRAKILSPSGRYVCFESQDEDEHCIIHLFDIHTKTWLFKDRCDHDRIQSQPMFTANDELIYCAFRKPNKVQLSYWKPGESKSRMIHEYLYPIVDEDFDEPASTKTDNKPQIPDDSFFHGLLSFDYQLLFDRILSSDGLTWLVINKQDRLIYLDLIDTRTGERKGRLDLSPIDLKKKAVRGINVAFDPQSKYLLLRLWPEAIEEEKDDERNWKIPTTLFWFDVANGKLLQSKTIRSELLRQGRLLWMNLKQLIFLGYKDYNPVLQILNLDEGYRQIAMSDGHWDVLEETWPRDAIDSDSSLLRASTDIHESIELDSSLLMYSSSHFLLPKHGTSGHGPQLPGKTISCRDLNTGRLLFSKPIDVDPNLHSFNTNTGFDYATALALPGPVLALKHHNVNPDWVNKPESWRYKLAEWIPSLKYQLSSTFRLYDPYTGHQQSEIIIPQNNMQTQLSADKRTFTALGQTIDDHYQCLIFDYPFHKPWLFIFYWAAGVGLALFILQTLKHWTAKPVK